MYKNAFGFSITDKKPHKNWPSAGTIVFDEFVLAYSKDGPPVLKCVSFTVMPSEKVIIKGITVNPCYNRPRYNRFWM
jgi:ABC-type multidrug transport system fused ATPase/permease subunit